MIEDKQIHNKEKTKLAIYFGLASRIFTAISAPLTIFLITKNLSKTEQGIYYLMTSFLGLQVLFELGSGVVLTQYFSHEFRRLSISKTGTLIGDKESILKIHKLILTSFSLFIFSALSFIIVTTPIWYSFNLTNNSEYNHLLLVWALAVVGVGSNIILTPLISLESASGNILSINKIESISIGLSTLTFWILLVSGFGILGVATSPIIRFIIYFTYFGKKRQPLLTQSRSLNLKIKPDFSLMAEIWPMQWRVALSWISGYFVFQLFVPAIFYFQGAIEAGKMGITIAIANSITSISLVIINTRAPQLGYLVSEKNWLLLDRMFIRSLTQGISVALLLSTVITFTIYHLQAQSEYGIRFLDYNQVGIILFGIVLQVGISHFGIYLRTHKQDPLVYLWVAHGLIQGGSTVILGKLFGTSGVATSILLVNLIILFLTVSFWKRFRIKMHHFKGA